LLYKCANKQLQRFQEFVNYNTILPLTVLTADKSAEQGANVTIGMTLSKVLDEYYFNLKEKIKNYN